MRKIILLLIALLFVFSSCATNYNTMNYNEKMRAVEGGVNLVDNPGLEGENIGECWGFSDNVFIVTESHTGERAFEIIPNGGTDYFYNVITADCDKEGSVVVSAWVNLSSAWDAENVSVILERQMKTGNNETYKVSPLKKSGWQQVFIEAPEAMSGVQHLVVKVECKGVSAPVYFDDFALVSLSEEPLNYIRNGSFTDGGSSWNGFVSGYGLDGSGAVLDSSSNKSLSQSSLFWGVKRPVFNSELDMKLSLYVSSDSASDMTLRLKGESKPSSNVVYKDFVIKPNSGWIEISLVIPAVSGSEEAVYSVELTDGEGRVNIDNVSLVAVALEKESDEISPVFETVTVETPISGNVLRNSSLEDLNADGSVTHWDVWPGNPSEGTRDYEVITDGAYDGDKALKINLTLGNPQAVYQYCVMDTAGKFDFNKSYTFSCMLKLDGVMTLDGKGVTIGIKRRGADGNEYNVYSKIEESDCDWTKFSVTAPSVGVEIVQYDVILDIGSGFGSITMDDCSLTVADELESGELVLTWN